MLRQICGVCSKCLIASKLTKLYTPLTSQLSNDTLNIGTLPYSTAYLERIPFFDSCGNIPISLGNITMNVGEEYEEIFKYQNR